MIGRKGLIAGLVLASAFGTANLVVAGTPIGGIVVKGGCNPRPNDPCPHKSTKIDNISVQLDLTRTETWTYEPVRGTLAASTARRLPVPGAVPGVGIVVKANSPRGSAMDVPVSENGSGQLPDLKDGTYDVVIRVPNAAFSTRPRDGGERGVELTFTIVKRGDRVVSLTKRRDSRKGAGSPKAAGF